MPTFRHGRNTVFKIDDATPTLRDISNVCREVSFSRPIDTAETSAFGTFDKTYVVGMRGATISISGMFDATVDGYLAGIVGQEASVSWEYGPEGSATGRVRYSGEGYLTTYDHSSPVTDMAGFTASVLITGAVTRDTWP